MLGLDDADRLTRQPERGDHRRRRRAHQVHSASRRGVLGARTVGRSRRHAQLERLGQQVGLGGAFLTTATARVVDAVGAFVSRNAALELPVDVVQLVHNDHVDGDRGECRQRDHEREVDDAVEDEVAHVRGEAVQAEDGRVARAKGELGGDGTRDREEPNAHDRTEQMRPGCVEPIEEAHVKDGQVAVDGDEQHRVHADVDGEYPEDLAHRAEHVVERGVGERRLTAVVDVAEHHEYEKALRIMRKKTNKSYV